MTRESGSDQKGLSDADLSIATEVAVEMARTAAGPLNAHAAALTFARAAMKDANVKRALAAAHRNIITRRAVEVSTSPPEPEVASAEDPNTPVLPTADAEHGEPPPAERADVPTDDTRTAQQELAASLAEIIDDVLSTRQFAVRAAQWRRQSGEGLSI
jgi:hypothetical protein